MSNERFYGERLLVRSWEARWGCCYANQPSRNASYSGKNVENDVSLQRKTHRFIIFSVKSMLHLCF